MTELENLRSRILSLTEEYYEKAHAMPGDFVPGDTFINYGGRFFDAGEMKNLVGASLDFWLTAGRWTDEFEKGLSEYLGVKYCAAVNSGSSANLLAFFALTSEELGERRIRRGDEVIAVACAFPTTVSPIIQYGAVPVFVDVEIPSYNIDCEKLQYALTPKTKAVFLAHSLGNPFNIKAVKSFCETNNLWLIEDNCDSLGSEYTLDGQTKKTGTWGDLATSSFYPPHHITTGEGGAVYTDNPLLIKLVRSFRDWGRDCWCKSGQDNSCGKRFSKRYGYLPEGYDHKYVYSHFGFNLKMTDLQAAVGCAQLKKLDFITKRRRENFAALYEGLKGVKGLILPEAEKNSVPSWFGFPLTVSEDADFSRNGLTKHLESRKIQTRNLFAGNILYHPAFDRMRRDNSGFRIVSGLPNSDFVMKNTFWTGVYPGMTQEKINWIIQCVREFCEK